MPRRHLVGYWSWLLATALVAAIAGLGLAGTIAIAGSEENRAPAANIIIAALALCAALAALRSPIQRLRGRPHPSSYVGGVLALLAVLLICLLLVAQYATVGQN
jgi:drug/metabolite transporter (DMT)-like permease